ncbi:hypothetical protein AB0C88_06335 [Streptomyces chartreusis]|uniref:hypothetical protein n=1 Tax=Streptomyces chartreusis TaxID=1969 RepID=UPI0033BFE9E6
MSKNALLHIGLAIADQVVKSPYGALVMLALFFLGVGIQARNRTCAYVGAVVLVLLMTQA